MSDEVEDVVDEELKLEDPYWICGTNLDGDDYPSIGNDYASREDALAGAVEELGYVEVGGIFQTGRVVASLGSPASPFDTDNIIDTATEQLHDMWTSGLVEKWEGKATKAVDDLQARLDELWDQWLKENKLRIVVLTIEDIEHHLMPASADTE